MALKQEHYLIEAQGLQESNLIVNLKKPPYMAARIYKFKTSRGGTEQTKDCLQKFKSSIQVEGYNIVLVFDSTIEQDNLYREEIDIELHRMAEFYLNGKMASSVNHFKHFEI